MPPGICRRALPCLEKEQREGSCAFSSRAQRGPDHPPTHTCVVTPSVAGGSRRAQRGWRSTIGNKGRDLQNFRDGTGIRVEQVAARLRKEFRAQRPDDRSDILRADAAEGGRRAAATKAAPRDRRRDALRIVLDAYPAVAGMSNRSAAGTLHRSWGDPGTAGGRMAEILGENAPSRSTLAKDIAALRPPVSE